jgi:hypothetical protein
LLRNARLGNPETIGRAAETAGLGYRQKITQVPDLERVMHRAGILCGSTKKCNSGLFLIRARARDRNRLLVGIDHEQEHEHEHE